MTRFRGYPKIVDHIRSKYLWIEGSVLKNVNICSDLPEEISNTFQTFKVSVMQDINNRMNAIIVIRVEDYDLLYVDRMTIINLMTNLNTLLEIKIVETLDKYGIIRMNRMVKPESWAHYDE